MFGPYPVSMRGARIYQFRRVLNDFPDQDVVQAFQTVRKAVASDSRVLVVPFSPSSMPFTTQTTLTSSFRDMSRGPATWLKVMPGPLVENLVWSLSLLDPVPLMLLLR